MEIFLLGDVNVNFLSKSIHKEIKDIFVMHGLYQIVKLCELFTKIAGIIKNQAFKLRDFVWKAPSEPQNLFVFGYVSKVFVEKELRRLKRGKDAGSDNSSTKYP